MLNQRVKPCQRHTGTNRESIALLGLASVDILNVNRRFDLEPSTSVQQVVEGKVEESATNSKPKEFIILDRMSRMFFL